MNWPWVSRALYEAEKARADAEHRVAEVERIRVDTMFTTWREFADRLATMLDMTIRPAPVSAVAAPVPDFQSFPPVVAGALALANAGFPKDVQRQTYIWAEAQLKLGTEPKEVARMLQEGRPVDIDMATAD